VRWSTTPKSIGATLPIAHERSQQRIVDAARNTCAAGVFVNRTASDQEAIDIVAPRRSRPKARCADSESRFLAIKKFSRSPALRLIGARQNRFFARIARG
jgi:hypothetical protein